jgi:hypothetical protein
VDTSIPNDIIHHYSNIWPVMTELFQRLQRRPQELVRLQHEEETALAEAERRQSEDITRRESEREMQIAQYRQETEIRVASLLEAVQLSQKIQTLADMIGCPVTSEQSWSPAFSMNALRRGLEKLSVTFRMPFAQHTGRELITVNKDFGPYSAGELSFQGWTTGYGAGKMKVHYDSMRIDASIQPENQSYMPLVFLFTSYLPFTHEDFSGEVLAAFHREKEKRLPYDGSLEESMSKVDDGIVFLYDQYLLLQQGNFPS